MILIILVLYKIKPEKSPGFMFCFNNWNSLHKKFRLVLYDNSPENTDLSNYSNLNNFEYYHDHKNHGLAKAYNYGLKQANIHNCEWLLLLDQDTVVNHDFFIELIN